MVDRPYYLDPFARIVNCHFGIEHGNVTHLQCSMVVHPRGLTNSADLNNILTTIGSPPSGYVNRYAVPGGGSFWMLTSITFEDPELRDFAAMTEAVDPVTMVVTRNWSAISEVYVTKVGAPGKPSNQTPALGQYVATSADVTVAGDTFTAQQSQLQTKYSLSGTDTGIRVPLTVVNHNFLSGTSVSERLRVNTVATYYPLFYEASFDSTPDNARVTVAWVNGYANDFTESYEFPDAYDLSTVSIQYPVRISGVDTLMTFNAFGYSTDSNEDTGLLRVLFKRSDL